MEHHDQAAHGAATGRAVPLFQGSFSAPQGPPLGTTREFEAAPSGTARSRRSQEGEAASRRVLRYALQAGARDLLGKRSGVYHCLRTIQRKGGGVEVWQAAEHRSAHYGNLMICGLHWVCPVCAVKIAQRRVGEVARAVKVTQEHGGAVGFMTVTIPHYQGQDLGQLLDGFLGAVRSFKGRRRYRDLMSRLGHLGEVRSLETTYGDNGWHPHTHSLNFFPEGVGAWAEVREELAAMWGQVVEGRGLGKVHEEHGLSFVEVGSRESGEDAQVVAEYAVKSDDGLGSRWGAADELVRGNSKQARRAGRTPFAILADYTLAGDEASGALFRAYAQAFKGKNHLRWSQGLREALGLSWVPLSDQELARLQVEPAFLLGRLEKSQWEVVLRASSTAKGELLDVAATGKWEDVLRFVAGLSGR